MGRKNLSGYFQLPCTYLSDNFDCSKLARKPPQNASPAPVVSIISSWSIAKTFTVRQKCLVAITVGLGPDVITTTRSPFLHSISTLFSFDEDKVQIFPRATLFEETFPNFLAISTRLSSSRSHPSALARAQASVLFPNRKLLFPENHFFHQNTSTKKSDSHAYSQSCSKLSHSEIHTA